MNECIALRLDLDALNAAKRLECCMELRITYACAAFTQLRLERVKGIKWTTGAAAKRRLS